MAIKIPQEVIDTFTSNNGNGQSKSLARRKIILPISNGLINHTYKVSYSLGPGILLQKINKQVFKKPKEVQANCDLLCQHAKPGFKLPTIIHSTDGKSLYKDRHGDYWRAFEFIEDGTTRMVAATAAQAKSASKIFAKFTAAFNGIHISNLKETIPGFHDLNLRYNQFEKSLQNKLTERMKKASPLADELVKRGRYKFFYEEIISSDAFPKRVVHHDAKISNVLFSRTTGRVICPVDLDTAMPGYFFSDPGDMIRSMACSSDENCTNFEKITVRKSYYEAITEGYLSVMKKRLTSAEKNHFHCCGLLMVYMQALRFLTDYMNGDTYYRTSYPEQNFDRAFNQLTLLKKLEDFLVKNYNLRG